MKHQYKTRGVCSTGISFEIADGDLHNVRFIGGCDGNLKAISKLVEGQNAKTVAALLAGNTCGFKPTSCADQLSKAITCALDDETTR